MPLTVKDSLFTVATCPPPGARAALRDYRPDARRTGRRARARAAGALMIGKTNVPEFAIRGLHRQPAVRRHRQSLEPSAHARRLQRRRGGGGGGRHRPAGDRAGRRRLDPPAGLAHRAGRPQALAQRLCRATTPCPVCCSTSTASARWHARSPTHACCSMPCAARRRSTARRWQRPTQPAQPRQQGRAARALRRAPERQPAGPADRRELPPRGAAVRRHLGHRVEFGALPLDVSYLMRSLAADRPGRPGRDVRAASRLGGAGEREVPRIGRRGPRRVGRRACGRSWNTSRSCGASARRCSSTST